MKTINRIISLAAVVLGFAACTPENTEVALSGLEINPSELTIIKGEGASLELVFTPDNVTDKSAVWNSSDNDIVTVDNDGKIVSYQSGTVVITAVSGGMMAVCNITVSEGPVTKLTLDRTELSLAPGDVYQFSVTYEPDGADTGVVEWTSSDDSVISVDNNGMATAKADGKAIVTVKAGDASAICNVTVVTKPEIGDYYYSDGTWSGELDNSKTVVGIIYYVGDPGIHDKLLRAEHPECVNGLVVSIEEFMDIFHPGYRDYQLHFNYTYSHVQDWLSVNCPGEFQEIRTAGLAMGDSGNLMLGYNNTAAMTVFNEAEENSEWPLVPVQKLVSFREENPLPANTSGWYIPSSKELYLMSETDITDNIFWDLRELEKLEVINNSLAMISGAPLLGAGETVYYWSSTEYYLAGSEIFLNFDYNEKPGGNPVNYNNNAYRYIFAF